MIFDRLERLSQYKGLNDNLDRLIDFTLSKDISNLKQGKYEIDEDNCWLNSNLALLVDGNTLYERHLEYIDLQIPLDEGEIIMVKPVESLEWPAFEGETGFTQGPDGTKLDFVPGMFAVFFPGDAHNCGLSKAGQTQVRKLVGKARAK